MERLYRIEIDVLLDDRMRTRVIQAARDDYRNSGGYWTEYDGEKVRIAAEELVVDTKTAFLEIADSAFRMILPEIAPHALRCGIEKLPEIEFASRHSGRCCRARSGHR